MLASACSAVEEATADEFERLYRTSVLGLLGVTRIVLPRVGACLNSDGGAAPTV